MKNSPHKDKLPALQTALRRGGASLILAFSLAAAPSGTARAEALPEPISPTAVTDDPVFSKAEWEKRNDIRLRLLQAAIEKYGPLSDKTIMSYSTDISDLQQRLNSYLKNSPATSRQAVIMDPDKIDIGMALGLADVESVRAFLGKAGAKIKDGALLSVTQRMQVPVRTPFGVSTHTPEPRAILDAHIDGAPACLIIPSSDRLPLLTIKNMTRKEAVRFINLHESWHCMDSQYKMTENEKSVLTLANTQGYNAVRGRPVFYQALAKMYNQETLADVGTSGDFIREGAPLEVIAHIKAFREERPEDITHLSAPALELLSERISDMGLERFRAMDDGAVKSLYFDITALSAMNETGMRTALNYPAAAPFRQFDYLIEASYNQDVAKGLRLARYAADQAATPGQSAMRQATEEEIRQIAAVKSWNAFGSLLDNAFAASGKITPITLTESYARMQNSLRDQMTLHPQSFLPPEMAVKLKESYKLIWRLDYVGANALRGVDIEKAEAEIFGPSKQVPLLPPTAPGLPR